MPDLQPLKPYYEVIQQFYDYIYEGKDRLVPRSLTPLQRLEILQIFADLIVSSDTTRLEERKQHQFQVARFPLSSLCFVCKDLAYVRHHIIQLQHGGLTNRRNIVPLCLYCHAEIHPWLKQEKSYSKPLIDWNKADSNPYKPYRATVNGHQQFYDWIISQQQFSDIAAFIVDDKTFPRTARRLCIFLDYYKSDQDKRYKIKKAHALWRRYCQEDIKNSYGITVVGSNDPEVEKDGAI